VPPQSRHEIDTIVKLTLDGPAADIEPLAMPSASMATGKKAAEKKVGGELICTVW